MLLGTGQERCIHIFKKTPDQLGAQLLLLTSIAGVDLSLSGLPIYLNQQMTDYSIRKSIDVWQMNAQRGTFQE